MISSTWLPAQGTIRCFPAPVVEVGLIRATHGTSLIRTKERLLETGMLTRKQLCATLGISRTTLGRWRQEGRVKARICNDRGEWLYRLPDELPASGKNVAPSAMDNPTARGAV